MIIALESTQIMAPDRPRQGNHLKKLKGSLSENMPLPIIQTLKNILTNIF